MTMTTRIFGTIFFCSLALAQASEGEGGGWYSWFGSSDDAGGDGDNGYDDHNDYSPLKSPLLNRELTTAVKAHAWPTLPSSALCEAFAFFQQEDVILQQKGIDTKLVATFMDEVVAQMTKAPSASFSDAKQMTTQSVKGSDLLSPYADLLDWTLQLRANSPLCEVHRGLARQSLQQVDSLTTFGDSDMLVVILSPLDEPPTVLTSLQEVEAMEWTQFSKVEGESADEPANATELIDEHMLPGEFFLSGQDNSASGLAILYGKMDSPKFGQIYSHLKRLDLPMLVRSLGAVDYEENPRSAEPTRLAGFGVRLDIRNVEYKVFDDRKKTSDDELDGAMINLTESEDLMPSEFLAGVNLTALEDNDDGEKSNILELRNKLWARHEAQQTQSQKIPPLWQRRQLPLQATAVLAAQGNGGKGDVLLTLKQLVQDLPSVASTLVQAKIPPHVHQWANALWEDPQISRVLSNAQFYVNGRATSVSRPSFNVFELLNVVRMEERRVQHMEKSITPKVSSLTSTQTALSRIQQAWIEGSSFGAGDEEDNDEDEEEMRVMGGRAPQKSNVFRIDVGRGWKQAVMYVNDVEKDSQYRQWTRNLQQMLMSMQYGMPPSVRRNLYTMTLVLDPTKTTVQNGGTENGGLDLTMKLMQNQYPVRLGLVIVDEDDVQKCKTWLQEEEREASMPCPLDAPILKADDSLSDTPATARAVHRLIDFFLREYGEQPGASTAYVEYLISYVTEELETNGKLTMAALLNVHGSLLEMMGLVGPGDSKAEAKAALLKNEKDLLSGTNVYGKGLRFAVERGLSPGMSFLNGRPLPDDEEGTHKVFSEEQQYLMGMIMNGQIRNDSPRSIYGKLLTGEGVFSRMHPLLNQGKASPDSYEELKHPFDSTSLIIQQDPDAKVYFAAEIVLDYGTELGLAQLKKILDSMESFPTSVSENDTTHAMAVGYRILPASKEAAASPLCPVLAKAGIVGLENLKSLATAVAQSSSPVSVEDLVTELDAEKRQEAKLATDLCASFDPPENSVARIVGNGRVFEFGSEFLASEDIELLSSMGWKRAKAVYELLEDLFPANLPVGQMIEPIAAVALFLAAEGSKATNRQDVAKMFERLEREIGKGKSMRFQWNDPSEGDGRLRSLVTAAVDPVDLSTQRLAPLLEVLRDHLKLPVQLILAPQTSISGDSDTPIASYYRFVAGSSENGEGPIAHFTSLPLDHVLTLRLDVPEPWDVQQTHAIQDTDNLRCDMTTGCSDDAHTLKSWTPREIKASRQLTQVEYGLAHLLAFGQCYEDKGPPNGLQFVLSRHTQTAAGEQAEVELSMDGTIGAGSTPPRASPEPRYSDTLVMKNVGYWQLRANPGVWDLAIEESSKGAEIFDFADAVMSRGRLVRKSDKLSQSKKIVLKDFVNKGEMILVKRRKGYEGASLFFEDGASIIDSALASDDVIHVFSLATGHLYERFLKIMMLSVTKRTSSKVKFWLFENFLSPTFKETSRAMARRIGCEVEFVTYKWPEWLRGQTEKQRIIWGYKILFLDVLFPLDVKKIIYVDADQVVRADLKELWDMDLQGAPYGYTPFCSSRATTVGYQFWRDGFWKNHLQGRPYHISALYVVDLKRFREELVGDQLRSIYQQLSADPNSLANLDQDLPNYAQNQVRIFSLPQDWLWCESWCSDETKTTAKTIDLCNNPLHKEPKVSMAKRVIDGPLFNESWVELDAEVEKYEKDFLQLKV